MMNEFSILLFIAAATQISGTGAVDCKLVNEDVLETIPSRLSNIWHHGNGRRSDLLQSIAKLLSPIDWSDHWIRTGDLLLPAPSVLSSTSTHKARKADVERFRLQIAGLKTQLKQVEGSLISAEANYRDQLTFLAQNNLATDLSVQVSQLNNNYGSYVEAMALQRNDLEKQISQLEEQMKSFLSQIDAREDRQHRTMHPRNGECYVNRPLLRQPCRTSSQIDESNSQSIYLPNVQTFSKEGNTKAVQRLVFVTSVAGYHPEDLRIDYDGGMLAVRGTAACSCDESCAVREFSRRKPVENVGALTAKLGSDGELTVYEQTGLAKSGHVPIEYKKSDFPSRRKIPDCQKKRSTTVSASDDDVTIEVEE